MKSDLCGVPGLAPPMLLEGTGYSSARGAGGVGPFVNGVVRWSGVGMGGEVFQVVRAVFIPSCVSRREEGRLGSGVFANGQRWRRHPQEKETLVNFSHQALGHKINVGNLTLN